MSNTKAVGHVSAMDVVLHPIARHKYLILSTGDFTNNVLHLAALTGEPTGAL